MRTTYTKLKQDFDKRVKHLQASCKHKRLAAWAILYWAIGHPTSTQVRRCLRCRKDVQTRQAKYDKSWWATANTKCKALKKRKKVEQ